MLALLAWLPETIQPVMAFPAAVPPWVPAWVQTHVEPTSAQARLQWEQQTLAQLRQKLEADLLHLTTETASLLNGTHTVISPTQAGDFEPHGAPRAGLMARVRDALAAGGTTRAQAVIWPEDLPPRPGREVVPLPPVVHPAFTPDELSAPPSGSGVDLPETYVLYHGPDDETSLSRTLRAWTWVAGPVGQDFPLVLVGLGEAARRMAETLAEDLNIRETLQILPELAPAAMPALFRGAAVVFHPASVSAWGGAIRHGLACGIPVVATETAWASAMVGPAAILVPPEDTRRLGASVIGIIVKENLSARLREAALERATAWREGGWGEKLAEVYGRVLKAPG
jgi:hypothetical protein